MDYYQVLKVGPNASRKEIEKAYQRLLKESRYDTSINRQEIETAYRVLSDMATKAQYDARNTIKTKRITTKKKVAMHGQYFSWYKRLTLPQLLLIFGISLGIAITFYSLRYGYVLEEYQAGDVLFDRVTHQKYGKIIQVQNDHAIGSKKIDAYQIEIDPKQTVATTQSKIVWLPQDIVKARCYIKPNKK